MSAPQPGLKAEALFAGVRLAVYLWKRAIFLQYKRYTGVSPNPW